MIVCHSFFYKYGQPKYLDKAVGLMQVANHMAFATQADWQQFLKVLRRSLEEVNGAARGVRLSLTDGQLEVTTKGGLDYAARLEYFKLKSVLKWSEAAGDFFDSGAQEGGAL